MNNNTAEDYVINTLNSSDKVTYTLDLNFNELKTDMIHVTEGNGIVLLDKFNILGGDIDPDKIGVDYKIQILDISSGDLQLALSDDAAEQMQGDFIIGTTTAYLKDDIEADTSWDHTYWNYTQDTLTYGTLGLATTKTENDSIGINVKEQITEDKVPTDPMGDTLKLVNNSDEHEDKTFTFDAADNTYTASDDLGETSSNLSIVGQKDGNETSTIDMNSHSGFEVTDDSTELSIENTSIENAQAEQGSVINAQTTDADITLTNVDLINNTATGEHGGAIYSSNDITITADDYDMLIEGNSTATDDEAIYMKGDTTLTLNVINDSSLTINDKINGETGYTVDLTGDDNSEINLTNQIDNAIINLSDITLNLSDDNHFANSELYAYSGTINLINDKAQTQTAQVMDIKGAITVNVDADLRALTMDRLADNATVSENGFIHVNHINLVSDSTEPEIAIPFATPLIKDSTDYIGPNILSKNTQITTALAPIYQYNVYYDNREDMGYFVFRNTLTFNPAILVSSVASLAGSFTAMTKTLDYSFEHADFYMNRSELSKQIIRSTDNQISNNTKIGRFRHEAIWAQPYGGREDINLDNGPKVDTQTHGIIAGIDSSMKDLSDNWSTVTTLYAGYNGTYQKYHGTKIRQGGGVAGLTQSFYNHNFFTALTATLGINRNKAETMYGDEYFNSYMSGVASKTGYNIEYQNGKYIIQPSMQVAYSYIHTPEYRNKADVKISSDSLQTLQLHPSLKFIANLNGYQPYASVGYVHNIGNKSSFKANHVQLPEMSIKPYMEYSVGIQKTWNDSMYGFVQATARTGGRKGVDVTIGIRGEF